jgi:hypothetical protein
VAAAAGADPVLRAARGVDCREDERCAAAAAAACSAAARSAAIRASSAACQAACASAAACWDVWTACCDARSAARLVPLPTLAAEADTASAACCRAARFWSPACGDAARVPWASETTVPACATAAATRAS